MPCTTILVGKKASYDGSTMIARNDDSGGGKYTSKKFVIVHPADQPRHYKSVLSHVEIDLPDDPMRYTACPSVSDKNGVWAATGINAANVGNVYGEVGGVVPCRMRKREKASGQPGASMKLMSV